MTTSWKRLIAAIVFVLPITALVATPVMAKSSHSTHKTSHHSHKKPATTTPS